MLLLVYLLAFALMFVIAHIYVNPKSPYRKMLISLAVIIGLGITGLTAYLVKGSLEQRMLEKMLEAKKREEEHEAAERALLIQKYVDTILRETEDKVFITSQSFGQGYSPGGGGPAHPRVLKEPRPTRTDVIAALGKPDIEGLESRRGEELLTYYWIVPGPSYTSVLLQRPEGYRVKEGITVESDRNDKSLSPSTFGRVKGYSLALRAVFDKKDQLTLVERQNETIGLTSSDWHWFTVH